jgi:TP901 family phage tail tape measure protein
MAKQFGLGLGITLQATEAELRQQIKGIEAKIKNTVSIALQIKASKSDINEQLNKFKDMEFTKLQVKLKIDTKVGYIHDQIKQLNSKISEAIKVKLKVDGTDVQVQTQAIKGMVQSTVSNISSVWDEGKVLKVDKGSIQKSIADTLGVAEGKISKLKTVLDESIKADNINKVKQAVATFTDDYGRSVQATMRWNYQLDESGKVVGRTFQTVQTDIIENSKKMGSTVDTLREKLSNIKNTYSMAFKGGDDSTLNTMYKNISQSINSIGVSGKNTEPVIRDINNQLKLLSQNAKFDTQIQASNQALADYTNNFKRLHQEIRGVSGQNLDSVFASMNKIGRGLVDIDVNTIKQKADAFVRETLPGWTVGYGRLTEQMKRVGDVERNIISQQFTARKGNEIKQFTMNVDGLAESIGVLEQGTRKLSLKDMGFLDKMKSAVPAFAAWMSVTTVVMQAVKAMKDGVKYIFEMDKALTDLNKVTNFTTQQMEGLVESSIALGKELGKSSVEIMNSFAEIGRSYRDLNPEELIAFSRVAVMTSNVTGMSASEGAKALSISILAFKKDMSDAESILDSFNEVQNNYRVTAQDLASSIETVGAAANQAGIKMEELIGYTTAMASATGATGSEVGTALKSIISRLSRVGTEELDMSKAEQTLSDFGIGIRKTSEEFRSFDDILKDIVDKWDDLSSRDKQRLAFDIGGTHHYSKLIGLIENFDIAVSSSNKAINSSGSAMKENQKQVESLDGKMKILKATVEGVWYNFFNGSVIFKGLISTLTVLVNLFGSLNTVLIATGTILSMVYLTQIKSIFDTIYIKILYAIDGMKLFALSSITGIKSVTTAMGVLRTQTLLQIIATKAQTLAVTALKFAYANLLPIIGLVVTGIMMYLNYSKMKREEAKREHEEMKQQQQQSIDMLADAQSYYKDNAKSINESVEVRDNLRKMQRNLIAEFGAEAREIDLLTGSYDDNIKKIKALKAEKQDKKITTAFEDIKQKEDLAQTKEGRTILKSPAYKTAQESRSTLSITDDIKTVQAMIDQLTLGKNTIPIDFEIKSMAGKDIIDLMGNDKPTDIMMKSATESLQTYLKALEGLNKDYENVLNEIKDGVRTGLEDLNKIPEGKENIFSSLMEKFYVKDIGSKGKEQIIKETQKFANDMIKILSDESLNPDQMTKKIIKIGEGKINTGNIEKFIKTLKELNGVQEDNSKYDAIWKQQLEDATKAYDASLSVIDKMNNAEQEVIKNKTLSASTLKDLIFQYPQLLSMLGDEQALLKEIKKIRGDEIPELEKSIGRKLELNDEFYQEVLKKNIALKNEISKVYQADANSFRNIENIKIKIQEDVLKIMGKDWKGYEEGNTIATLENAIAQRKIMLKTISDNKIAMQKSFNDLADTANMFMSKSSLFGKDATKKYDKKKDPMAMGIEAVTTDAGLKQLEADLRVAKQLKNEVDTSSSKISAQVTKVPTDDSKKDKDKTKEAKTPESFMYDRYVQINSELEILQGLLSENEAVAKRSVGNEEKLLELYKQKIELLKQEQKVIAKKATIERTERADLYKDIKGMKFQGQAIDVKFEGIVDPNDIANRINDGMKISNLDVLDKQMVEQLNKIKDADAQALAKKDYEKFKDISTRFMDIGAKELPDDKAKWSEKEAIIKNIGIVLDKFIIDRYSQMESKLSEIEALLSRQDALLKVYKDDEQKTVNIYQEQIDLLKEKQMLIAGKTDMKRTDRATMFNEIKDLKFRGQPLNLKFEGILDEKNIANSINDGMKMSNVQDVIARLANEYNQFQADNLGNPEVYEPVKKQLEDIIKKFEDWSKLTGVEIPNLITDWHNLRDSVNGVGDSMKKTVEEFQKTYKEQVEKGEQEIRNIINKGLELRKKALDDEVEAVKKATDEKIAEKEREWGLEDKKRRQEKEVKNVQQIQSKIDALARDTSLSGIAKRKKLEEDLAKELESIEENRIKDSRNAQKEDLQNNLQTKQNLVDDEKKQLDEKFNNEKIASMSSSALAKQSFDEISKEFPELFKILGDNTKTFYGVFEGYANAFDTKTTSMKTNVDEITKSIKEATDALLKLEESQKDSLVMPKSRLASGQNIETLLATGGNKPSQSELDKEEIGKLQAQYNKLNSLSPGEKLSQGADAKMKEISAQAKALRDANQWGFENLIGYVAKTGSSTTTSSTDSMPSTKSIFQTGTKSSTDLVPKNMSFTSLVNSMLKQTTKPTTVQPVATNTSGMNLSIILNGVDGSNVISKITDAGKSILSDIKENLKKRGW